MCGLLTNDHSGTKNYKRKAGNASFSVAGRSGRLTHFFLQPTHSIHILPSHYLHQINTPDVYLLTSVGRKASR